MYKFSDFSQEPMGKYVLLKDDNGHYTHGYLFSYGDGPKEDDLYVIKPSLMDSYEFGTYDVEYITADKYSIECHLRAHFNSYNELIEFLEN